MALKDLDRLITEINDAVHVPTTAQPGKVTAPALNAVLVSLATELTARPAAGVPDVAATLTGASPTALPTVAAVLEGLRDEQYQTPYLFQVFDDLNVVGSGQLSLAQARQLVDNPGTTLEIMGVDALQNSVVLTLGYDQGRAEFVASGLAGVNVPTLQLRLVGHGQPGAATFGQLAGQPLDNAALATALAAKADRTDARLTGLDALVNSLAVRIGSDATRTRTYYAGVGTQAAKNADDGLVRALAAAQPGDTVQVATPIRMPFADPYAAVLRLRAGTTLDLAGFDISSVLSQDGLGFDAGTYVVRGGDATIYSNGQGSCGLTWPDGANPTVRTYDLHLVNRGSASAALLRSGSLWQRGSVEVDSPYNATGVNLMTNNARYELVGDLTVRTASAGLEVGGGGQALLRQGRCLVATAGAMLARIYDGGQLELADCVLDVAAGPTTGGARLGGGSATLILTSVTVLGGSPVGVATGAGHLLLRGSTTLPTGYDVAYLRGLGLTVTDERPAAAAAASAPAPAALEFVFEAGFADSVGRTLGARQAGTYASEQRQNVADVRYQVAGQAVGLPLTLAPGDVLQVAITRADTTRPAVLTLLG